MESKPVCLIISTTADSGSIPEAIRRDIVDARREGMEVVVATGRGLLPSWLRNGEPVRHIRIGGRMSALMHYSLAYIFDAEGRGSIAATRQLIHRADRLAPKRIILHNLHGHYLNLSMFVRWLMRRAELGADIVWTIHDLWPATGHCAFLPPEGCPYLETGCKGGNCPMQKAYPLSLISRAASNHKRKHRQLTELLPHVRVRAVSQWLANILGPDFKTAAKSLVVLYPQANPTFTPPPEGAPRAGFALCVAKPWHKFKGFDDLPAIRAALPTDLQLMVVGVNPKQARQLKHPGIICAPVQPSPEDMVWYYRNASVFINPSYAETFGLTTREALACDTPVALYAPVGGATEGIESHPHVITVPPGEPEALAKAALAIRRKC